MLVFIIGYMGAGKSTVGKRLATKLDMPFVDLDDAFEERYRYSIPRFFEHFGEEKFRELEHACLRSVIAEHVHAVISTGGGTPCHYDNMALMNDAGLTVYLEMRPSSLARRLADAKRLRPLIRDLKHGDMQGYVSRQLSEREDFYLKAKLRVKGENLDLDALVAAVRSALDQ